MLVEGNKEKINIWRRDVAKLSKVEEEWLKLAIAKDFDKDNIFAMVLFLNSDNKLQKVVDFVKANPKVTEEEIIEKFLCG